MEPAQFLNPDTSSQLKKSSEIFSAYLKAKQEAALANAAKASVDAQGNYDATKYVTSALMGGVPITDAQAGSKDFYEAQQRMAADAARQRAMRTERTQIGTNPADRSPIYAQPGTVDTRQVALDPRLAAVNAGPQTMDAEQERILATQRRNMEAGIASLNAQSVGAPQVSGVGTTRENASPVEATLYGVQGEKQNESQYDAPLMAVKGLDAETARDVAYGLRSQGLYKDTNDVPGPNMQGALDQWYGQQRKALIAKEPMLMQFQGKYGDYLTAKKAWQSELDALPVKAREELAGWRDKRQANTASRVGVKGTLQTQGIQAKEFADSQALVNAAHAEGYSGVSKETLPKYNEIRATQDWLMSVPADITKMREEFAKTGQIDLRKFNGLMIPMTKSSSSADGIDNIGAKADFDNLLSSKKDWQQAIGRETTVKGVAEQILKNNYVAQDPMRVLDVLEAMVTQQIHSGKTTKELDRFRIAKPEKKGLDGAIKEKITGAIKTAADIPAGQRKVGMKAKLGNSGKIGTWNGKGWDVQ